MNIAIIGHGKMGKAVERILIERHHSVRIVPVTELSARSLHDVSCVIEFTHASVGPAIIRQCIDAGIPLVSGTTGWEDEKADVFQYCLERSGALLWSPNFSIGMHLVFELNTILARLMNKRPEYEVKILETHHIEKKDTPSGTAISLAHQILDELDRKKTWQLNENEDLLESTLEVTSVRLPDVKGIHRITYTGPHDVISLRHKAISRDAFAFGAVLSAEWLVEVSLSGKRGVYTFSDVLGSGRDK